MEIRRIIVGINGDQEEALVSNRKNGRQGDVFGAGAFLFFPERIPPELHVRGSKTGIANLTGEEIWELLDVLKRHEIIPSSYVVCGGNGKGAKLNGADNIERLLDFLEECQQGLLSQG